MIEVSVMIAKLIGIDEEEYNRWCLAAKLEGDKTLSDFIKRIVRNYMQRSAE